MSISLDNILESNDPKKIGPIMKSFLSQSDDKIEKVIDICVDKYNEEKFFDFLRSAIYNDKDIVFKIMDKHKYNYDVEYFKNLAIPFKAFNCSKYFISISS